MLPPHIHVLFAHGILHLPPRFLPYHVVLLAKLPSVLLSVKVKITVDSTWEDSMRFTLHRIIHKGIDDRYAPIRSDLRNNGI